MCIRGLLFDDMRYLHWLHLFIYSGGFEIRMFGAFLHAMQCMPPAPVIHDYRKLLSILEEFVKLVVNKWKPGQSLVHH